MNPVAVNVFATKSSTGFNVYSDKKDDFSKGFGAVFKNSVTKINNSHNNSVEKLNANKKQNVPTEGKKSSDNLKKINNEDELNKDVKEEKEMSFDKKVSGEKSEKMKTDRIKEANTQDIESDAIEEKLLLNVSEILDISKEELVQILNELGMGISDLLSNEGIKKVVFKVFNLENDGELLKSMDAVQATKEVKAFISELGEVDVKKYLNSQNEAFENLVDKIQDEVVNVKENSTENYEDNKIPTKQVELSTNNGQLYSNQDDISTEEESLFNDLKVEITDNRSDDGKNMSNSEEQQSFDQIFGNVLQDKMISVSTEVDGTIVYKEISAKEIINQVVSKVKVELGQNNQTISIQLTPENLGKVSLSIAANEGVVTGSIVAESNAVKEMIEMNLLQLKTNLDDQGIKVDEIEVVVGDSNQFFEKNDGKNSFNDSSKQNKKRNIAALNRANALADDEVVDEEETNTYFESDHSVEYSV